MLVCTMIQEYYITLILVYSLTYVWEYDRTLVLVLDYDCTDDWINV